MDKQDKIFNIADKVTKYNFKEIWAIEGSTMLSLKKEDKIQNKIDQTT